MDESQFELARLRMVKSQIADRGVRDSRVLDAMRTIPRHLFVADKLKDHAYNDSALDIGRNQTISQPYIVAVMTEALGLTGSERVLEIGTGSGYQTAILAALCKRVYTVERISKLSRCAQNTLNGLKITNISYLVGDGSRGWISEAPFDAILVTASPPSMPPPLNTQLTIGGKMVVPVGDRGSQTLQRITRINEREILIDNLLAVSFVPLIGEFGWRSGGLIVE